MSSQPGDGALSKNRPSIADKRRTFRTLHESGCFVIPNPWDIGSARYLQGLGFKALAATSSGFAWSQGYPDNGVTRDKVLGHLSELVASTDVPINADFENGFGADAAGVADQLAKKGRFDGFAQAVQFGEINKVFADEAARRRA